MTPLTPLLSWLPDLPDRPHGGTLLTQPKSFSRPITIGGIFHPVFFSLYPFPHALSRPALSLPLGFSHPPFKSKPRSPVSRSILRSTHTLTRVDATTLPLLFRLDHPKIIFPSPTPCSVAKSQTLLNPTGHRQRSPCRIAIRSSPTNPWVLRGDPDRLPNMQRRCPPRPY